MRAPGNCQAPASASASCEEREMPSHHLDLQWLVNRCRPVAAERPAAVGWQAGMGGRHEPCGVECPGQRLRNGIGARPRPGMVGRAYMALPPWIRDFAAVRGSGSGLAARADALSRPIIQGWHLVLQRLSGPGTLGPQPQAKRKRQCGVPVSNSAAVTGRCKLACAALANSQ